MLLAGVFLVYPRPFTGAPVRSSDPQRAAFQNLILDCFLVSIPLALMGYPLWPTFTMFITTNINNAFAGGLRGLLPALGAFAAGSLLGGAFTGFAVTPDSINWPPR